MLDSLVRVSRRVLRVPKSIASPTGNLRFSWPCPGTALGPYLRVRTDRTCGGMGANTFVRMDRFRPDTVSVPSCSQPGDRGSAACAETTRQAPTRAVDRHTKVRDVLLGEKCTTATPECSIRWWRALAIGTKNGPPGVSRTNGSRTPSTMNFPIRSFGFLRFTPERFHVFLNSLFKFLFNIPSRYLFAIGLVVEFSLRWSSPPT